MTKKIKVIQPVVSIATVTDAIAASFGECVTHTALANNNLMHTVIKQSAGLAIIVQNSTAHKELGKALQTSLESKAHLSKESARTIAIKLTRVIIYLTHGHVFKALSNYNAAYMEARNAVVPFWVSKASKVVTPKAVTLAPALQAANVAISKTPNEFVAQLPHAVQIAACIALLKKLNIPVPAKLKALSTAK